MCLPPIPHNVIDDFDDNVIDDVDDDLSDSSDEPDLVSDLIEQRRDLIVQRQSVFDLFQQGHVMYAEVSATPKFLESYSDDDSDESDDAYDERFQRYSDERKQRMAKLHQHIVDMYRELQNIEHRQRRVADCLAEAILQMTANAADDLLDAYDLMNADVTAEVLDYDGVSLYPSAMYADILDVD